MRGSRRAGHQCPVATTEPQTTWCTPQGYLELMSEKEILDFKSAPRLEQVAGKRPKQIEDRAHRVGSCAYSASMHEPCGYDFRERPLVVITEVPATR
jgi:hypothetical protein